jgi:hypothetical protein
MTDSGGFQVFSLGAAFGHSISKITKGNEDEILLVEFDSLINNIQNIIPSKHMKQYFHYYYQKDINKDIIKKYIKKYEVYTIANLLDSFNKDYYLNPNNKDLVILEKEFQERFKIEPKTFILSD